MKDLLVGGQMSFVGVTGTPKNWQRPVIKAGNPRHYLNVRQGVLNEGLKYIT